MERWFEDQVLAIVAPGVGVFVTMLNGLVGTVPSPYIGIMWACIVALDTAMAVNRLRTRW